MSLKGASYFLRSKLYIALTNECNSLSPIALRGPSFVMPESSKFEPLPANFEPTALQVFEIVDRAFEEGLIGVTSMDSDEITFAGVGEPLLRMGVLTEAAMLIKEKRHGAQLRVKTNGLILSKDCDQVAKVLKSAGIESVSICLGSDNPTQYADLLRPQGVGFGDMCSFVIACVESGLDVTCSAVEKPGVNIGAVRALSQSLGAPSFSTAPYFP